MNLSVFVVQRIALKRQRRKKCKTRFSNDAELKTMISPYDEHAFFEGNNSYLYFPSLQCFTQVF